jgi:hypothetical protein
MVVLTALKITGVDRLKPIFFSDETIRGEQATFCKIDALLKSTNSFKRKIFIIHEHGRY